MTRPHARPLKVIVLTGSTGRTGEQVVRAALAQFEQPAVQLVVQTQVRTPDEVRKIIAAAAREEAVVCHTFVAPEVRQAVADESRRWGISVVDILGPVVTALADRLEVSPRGQPGLSYAMQKEQFDRIDAVDFTLAHDDGQRLADLDQADVVLVGPSRSSKSVTCFFLAYRGVRAANVPLILGCELPKELLRIDAAKVIGLTMNAHRLRSIREARAERSRELAPALDDYIDLRTIAKELNYIHALMDRHAWRRIDVSYKSTEEVADQVLRLLGRAGRADEG